MLDNMTIFGVNLTHSHDHSRITITDIFSKVTSSLSETQNDHYEGLEMYRLYNICNMQT